MFDLVASYLVELNKKKIKNKKTNKPHISIGQRKAYILQNGDERTIVVSFIDSHLI